MRKKQKFEIRYMKSKWGNLILNEILKNGPTLRTKLKKIKDVKTGKEITEKMLWETIQKMIKKKIIIELPPKGKNKIYDLSEKFRAKKLNQLIYLYAREQEEMRRGIIITVKTKK